MSLPMSVYTYRIKFIKSTIETLENTLNDFYTELHKTQKEEYDAYIELQVEETKKAVADLEQAEQTELNKEDEELRQLCMKPLVSETDSLKLKELEQRFPGAKFLLTTYSEQHVINSVKRWRGIYSHTSNITYIDFKSFGLGENEKPNLMAEWKGLYICLSHLF